MEKDIILIPGGTLEQKGKKGHISAGIRVRRFCGREETVGLESRLRAAAELYKRNPFDTKIVVAGRHSAQLQKHNMSHTAMYAKEFLMKKCGVDKEHIVIVHSCNGATYGDMQAFTLWLQENENLTKKARITLLTSQFHLLRAYAMFVDAYNRGGGKLFLQCLPDDLRHEIGRELQLFESSHSNGDLTFARSIFRGKLMQRAMSGAGISIMSAEEILLQSAQHSLRLYGEKILASSPAQEARSGEAKGFRHFLEGTYDVHVGAWVLQCL